MASCRVRAAVHHDHFVGSAELQVRVVVQLARDGWRLLRFPAPAGQLSRLPGAGGGRRPRVAPCDADGLAHDLAGFVVRPALVSVTAARPRAFYPVWTMFLQHRMRCVSTVRWRASLTI